MASFHSDQTGLAGHEAGATRPGDAGSDEVLAPVIAGAYARGVAETLDMLGLPGLFLDGTGAVIFVSRAATALLAGPLRLHMRHLAAESAADNRLLATFIADAIGEGREAATLRLARSTFELHRLPRTEAAARPGQMVRAILILLHEADPRHGALTSLLCSQA